MFFFQPAYPDPFDISSAVPTVPAYVNDVLTLSLPVVNQVQVDEKTPICFFLTQPSIQMTWADVSWLALYCRKLKIVFMSVNVPTDFTDEIIFG